MMKVKTVLRQKLEDSDKYKVKFQVELAEGGSYKGSVIFKSKPTMNKVIDFIKNDMNFQLSSSSQVA